LKNRPARSIWEQQKCSPTVARPLRPKSLGPPKGGQKQTQCFGWNGRTMALDGPLDTGETRITAARPCKLWHLLHAFLPSPLARPILELRPRTGFWANNRGRRPRVKERRPGNRLFIERAKWLPLAVNWCGMAANGIRRPRKGRGHSHTIKRLSNS